MRWARQRLQPFVVDAGLCGCRRRCVRSLPFCRCSRAPCFGQSSTAEAVGDDVVSTAEAVGDDVVSTAEAVGSDAVDASGGATEQISSFAR